MYFTQFKKGPYSPGTRECLHVDKSDLKEIETQTDLVYTINNYGYRGKIEPGGDAAFGCSITLGFFVSEGEQWPARMNLFNGAITAASNDMIARQAATYIQEYSPNNVYVMWTYPSRREIVDDRGKLLKFCATDVDVSDSLNINTAQFMLINNKSDCYNIEKNQLLVHSIATAHGTNVHFINKDIYDRYDYLPLAANGHHPGPNWHKAVADYFSHN